MKPIRIILIIITTIYVILTLLLIGYEWRYKKAIYATFHNNKHCQYDKSNLINCSGIRCLENGKNCYPLFIRDMSPDKALKQVDQLSPKSGWTDINHLVRFNLNLVSGVSQKSEEYLRGYQVSTFTSKFALEGMSTGYVLYIPTKYVFVVLRGTRGKKEWSQDMSYKQVECKLLNYKGGVHYGFYEVFTKIVNKVINILDRSNITTNTTIVITGHSLGSALTILLGTYINKKYENSIKIVCFAFACPRVFSDTIAMQVDKSMNDNFMIYRFSNSDDLITNAPAIIMPNLKDYNKPWMYKHVGTEFRYSKNWGSYMWNHYLANYIQAYDESLYQQ